MEGFLNSNPNNFATPSRREFLNYALGASVLLAGAGTCAGLAWFTQRQRFIGARGSGLFELSLRELPPPGGEPVFFAEAQAYLTNPGSGLLALLAPCPFDRYVVRWSESNLRFECPGCGSRFTLAGEYLKGSAAQDLNQATLVVTTAAGSATTSAEGEPVSVEGAQAILLDVQQTIPGTPRAEVGLP
jgi:hypothetical protein